jgi:plastocyanin
MRKWIAMVMGLALVIGGVALVAGTRMATAQGGGTIEAEVKYNGPAQVEKLKVNKDVEKCGNEAVIEKVVVGGNKGLANAVVSVPEAKGAPTAKKITVDQHGCKFVPHVSATTPGEVELKNSDDILHNIHTYSQANPSINKAQPKF